MISIKSTTSENIYSSAAVVSMVILVGGSDASSVILDDSLDGSGIEKIELKALANDSKIASFTSSTGIRFSNGIYSTITGTDAVVFVYLK